MLACSLPPGAIDQHGDGATGPRLLAVGVVAVDGEADGLEAPGGPDLREHVGHQLCLCPVLWDGDVVGDIGLLAAAAEPRRQPVGRWRAYLSDVRAASRFEYLIGHGIAVIWIGVACILLVDE